MTDTPATTERPTRIECAAIRTEDGAIHSLPRPARHHDIIQDMVRRGVTERHIAEAEQGFTTDTMPFVRRQSAKRIAYKAGQLLKETHPMQLFSEDVW